MNGRSFLAPPSLVLCVLLRSNPWRGSYYIDMLLCVCVLPRFILISLRAVNRIRGISWPAHIFYLKIKENSNRDRDLGVVERKRYLDVNTYLHCMYSHRRKFFFSFPQTLTCKEEGFNPRKCFCLFFRPPFSLIEKPLGVVITKSVTHCNIMWPIDSQDIRQKILKKKRYCAGTDGYWGWNYNKLMSIDRITKKKSWGNEGWAALCWCSPEREEWKNYYPRHPSTTLSSSA